MSYWKGTERRHARRFGTERVGNTGRATADAMTDWLAIESKARKTLPQWLKNAVLQAKRNALTSQLPIVILHEKHKPTDSDLVVMELRDFLEWFGGEGTDETQS